MSACLSQTLSLPKMSDKTNMDVHYSSATAEWATPDFLYNWLDKQYHFTLDPCCTHETAKCSKHFTIVEDGLLQSWGNEIVFMNPPYGRAIRHWIKKAYEESLLGATVVCLIPARTDTTYYYIYCTQAAEIIFLAGRVKFVDDGKILKGGAPFPSCIVVFTPQQSPLKVSWKKLSECV